MIKDGLTKGQRYYMRHREELCRKRREKYKNNAESREREIECMKIWKANNPYKVYLHKKKYYQSHKNIIKNKNVD